MVDFTRRYNAVDPEVPRGHTWASLTTTCVWRLLLCFVCSEIRLSVGFHYVATVLIRATTRRKGPNDCAQDSLRYSRIYIIQP